MYYKKMGLNAMVRNIPENKQAKVVYKLLQIYNPDIPWFVKFQLVSCL